MYTGNLFSERLKQVAFLLTILLLGYVIVNDLTYFLSSLLGAITLYVILRKPYRYLLARNWKPLAATSVLLLATVLLIIVLGVGILGVIYEKLTSYDPNSFFENVKNIQALINERFHYNIFSEEVIAKGVAVVSSILPRIISTTGSVVTNLLMMMFLLYFMLKDSATFEKGVEQMVPLSASSISLLKKETKKMVLSNAIGIPVIMLGQGAAAGLGFWIAGAGDPVVWGIATGIFGLVPVIGTAGVWLPLSLNLLIGGHIWQGIFLLAWGAIVISSVDNLIRMVFLSRQANVHPLIALFGVLLGINLFGFWGIIFGPLLLSSFFLLLRIYKKEFLS